MDGILRFFECNYRTSKMLSLCFLTFCYFSLTLSANKCKWTATDELEEVSGTLNLNPIKGIEYYSYSERQTDDHVYNITMCSDNLLCGGTNSMMIQQAIGDSSVCYYLGIWNESMQPKLSMTQDGPSWQFVYKGQSSTGCSTSGRTTVLNFWCDETKPEKSDLTMTADEDTPCQYQLDLYTGYACFYDGSSSSSSMSGGSIFIIVIIVLLVSYCVLGYIFNKVRHKDNGWGDVEKNIPNYEFWILLPKYVIAGCVVTKEVVTEAVSGSGSQHESIKEEPLQNESES